MKTVLIANSKGGVGKTTLSDELIFELERRDKKVSFISLDPQGGALHEPSLSSDDDDYMVIDTPGYVSKDFSKWIDNADIVLFPTTPSIFDLMPLQKYIELFKKNKKQKKYGVVINMHDERRIVDREFEEALNNFGYPLITKIPGTTAIKKAQANKERVYGYVKKDYLILSAIAKLADFVMAK
jgi:chromosome partitioning protein